MADRLCRKTVNHKRGSGSSVLHMLVLESCDEKWGGDLQTGGSNALLGWILLGLMAGFMASNIVRSSGQGLLLDLVLGVIGAVVSGYLFTAIGATGLTGSNLYSMFAAIIGAVVVLWLYHARGSSV